MTTPDPTTARDPSDDDVRAALHAARAEAVDRLAALTGGFDELVAASRDSNADDEHDPEGATIAFERSQLDSLVVRTRTQVAEIEAAEQRLANGRYGRCEQLRTSDRAGPARGAARDAHLHRVRRCRRTTATWPGRALTTTTSCRRVRRGAPSG